MSGYAENSKLIIVGLIIIVGIAMFVPLSPAAEKIALPVATGLLGYLRGKEI